MDIDLILEQLKREWDRDNGFFGQLRIGKFDELGLSRFMELLKHITNDTELNDRRLVTLLWDVPLFMEWQTSRIQSAGFDSFRYAQVKSQVYEAIRGVLNCPATWD